MAESYLDRALKAADWYVNTQVRMRRPDWDANHGRLVYTYHMPTRRRILGLSWTQGRGIITLLSAYEATEKPEYLQTAVQAGEYIKHLQVMDNRSALSYGAIREECPASWYSYPRDAFEAGLGLIFLYRITADEEYLYRAKLFGEWIINTAMDETGWTPGSFFLQGCDADKQSERHSFCLGGGVPFFAYLAKATGDSKYMHKGFRPMVEHLKNTYVRDEDGVILVVAKGKDLSKAMGHHAAVEERYQGVAVNDDACGITMLVAYKELGQEEYLDLSIKYGDWMLADEYPRSTYAAAPLRALTLAELSAVSGEKKYAQFAAESLVPEFMAGQMLGTGDPAVEGAFRGEDEPPHYYGPKEAKREEFVNNRVTAYAANALFKLDGKVFGPYYSALNWEAKRVPTPAPELLAPYRI